VFKKLMPLWIVLAVVAVVGGLYAVQPSRTGEDRASKAEVAKTQLAQIEETAEPPAETTDAKAEESPKTAPTQEENANTMSHEEVNAADVVRVKFECSNGSFVVECHKDWAPLGAERFLDLVKQDFFDGVRFFRMVTNPQPFVVQFGISGDPKVAQEWQTKTIKDEPRTQSNLKGTITFAKSQMPNSRTTQIFINLGDNTFLDGMGFAPFGKVVEGMDTVLSFNDEYQDRPTSMQGQIVAQGNAFLDQAFPGLDYIKSASFVE